MNFWKESAILEALRDIFWKEPESSHPSDWTLKLYAAGQLPATLEERDLVEHLSHCALCSSIFWEYKKQYLEEGDIGYFSPWADP